MQQALFQYAYKTQKSEHFTKTVLLKTQNSIYVALSKGECQGVVVLDLWALFDTIVHDI